MTGGKDGTMKGLFAALLGLFLDPAPALTESELADELLGAAA